MENSNQLSEEELRSICDKVIGMLLAKNQDYGGASFDLGLNGNMVHLWDKVKRYRTLVESQINRKKKPNFESIEDTLQDIIGYALIGLTIIKHDKT
jgi:hypothetical protein